MITRIVQFFQEGCVLGLWDLKPFHPQGKLLTEVPEICGPNPTQENGG